VSGYSKNPVTAEKMLRYLQPLARGELCTWATTEHGADYFAYKIREALYIARLHKGMYERLIAREGEESSKGGAYVASQMLGLAKAAERTRIVVISPSIVEARLQKGVPEAMVLEGSTPTQGYENPGKSVVRLTKQTPHTIVEAWKAQQPSNTPLHFPHAGLSYEELVELHEWATEMQLMIFEVDGAITIQKKTLDLMQFAWTPTAPSEEDVDPNEFPFRD
jgi:hypothetical protein